MLHYGTCSWQDIAATLTSTAHLPADVFRAPLEKMEAAWDDRDLRKNSVNQMVGLWAIKNTEALSVVSSNDDVDGKGRRTKRAFDYDSGIMYDHIYVTSLVDNASMRPIHDQILHTEYTRMAQLFYIITQLKIPQRCISNCKTDCFILQGYAAKTRALLEKVAETRICDLGGLRRKYEKVVKTQHFLDGRAEMPSSTATGPAFQ
jgi:hypothetical protein